MADERTTTRPVFGPEPPPPPPGGGEEASSGSSETVRMSGGGGDDDVNASGSLPAEEEGSDGLSGNIIPAQQQQRREDREGGGGSVVVGATPPPRMQQQQPQAVTVRIHVPDQQQQRQQVGGRPPSSSVSSSTAGGRSDGSPTASVAPEAAVVAPSPTTGGQQQQQQEGGGSSTAAGTTAPPPPASSSSARPASSSSSSSGSSAPPPANGGQQLRVTNNSNMTAAQVQQLLKIPAVREAIAQSAAAGAGGGGGVGGGGGGGGPNQQVRVNVQLQSQQQRQQQQQQQQRQNVAEQHRRLSLLQQGLLQQRIQSNNRALSQQQQRQHRGGEGLAAAAAAAARQEQQQQQQRTMQQNGVANGERAAPAAATATALRQQPGVPTNGTGPGGTIHVHGTGTGGGVSANHTNNTNFPRVTVNGQPVHPGNTVRFQPTPNQPLHNATVTVSGLNGGSRLPTGGPPILPNATANGTTNGVGPTQQIPAVAVVAPSHNLPRGGGGGGGQQVVQTRLHVPPLMPQPVPYHRIPDSDDTTTSRSSSGGNSGIEGGVGSGRIVGSSSAEVVDGSSSCGDGGVEGGGNNVGENGSSGGGGNDAPNGNNNSRGQFECSICFEYMDDPAGCGKCAHRFCFHCITRVANEAIAQETARRLASGQSSNSTQPPPTARCPCCRETFHPTQIIRDVDLRQRMDLASKVTCPFPGCGQRLSLAECKRHEATCLYMKMRCRYASFGCTWTGPKRDVVGHERVGCPYGKIGDLVEQFRRVRAEHGHALGHMQHQLIQSSRMVHLLGDNLRRLQSKSPNNIMDVMNLVYTSSCHPVNFLQTKDLWRQLYGTEMARGMVYNVLYLLPTVIVIFRIVAAGISGLFRLGERDPTADTFDSHIDTILLSLAMGMLGLLLGVCFHLDMKSPNVWCDFQFPMFRNKQITYFREVAALSILAIHYLCIEFDEHNESMGFMLWGCALMSTTFFPAFLRTFLDSTAAGRPNGQTEDNNTTVPTTNARARSVTLFGLRYGFNAALGGFVPCLDAILIMQTCKTVLKLPDHVTAESTECFLSQLNIRAIACLGVARVAMILASSLDTTGTTTISTTAAAVAFTTATIHAIMAVGMILIVNHVVHKLDMLGVAVGRKVASTSTTLAARTTAATDFNSAEEQQARLRAEERMDGMISFGLWMGLLGCIVIA